MDVEKFPSEPRRRVFPALLWASILGLTMSVAGFYLARQWEDRALHARFVRHFDGVVASLGREIDLNLEVLRDLEGLFGAYPAASRLHFRRFARPVVGRNPSIKALEWIPRVRHSERIAHESLAQKEGLTAYRITERQAQGQMVEADVRDEYFPVFYVEPLEDNEAAVGFDLASNEARKQAIEQARDSGSMMATAPVKPVRELGDQLEFLVFAPVYEGTASTIDARRRALRGFAVGVYRVGDLFTNAMQGITAQPHEIALRLFDASPGEQPLALNDQSMEHADLTISPQALEHAFELPGRIWRLNAWPTRQFLDSQRGWLPIGVLFTGLMVTVLTVAYLRAFMYRERAVRRLAALRSAEVEVGERCTSVILDTAVDAIITANQHGIIQRINPAAEQLFGYAASELVGRNVSLLMPEPYRSEHDGYLERYQRTGEPHIIGIGRQLVGCKKDGSTFPMTLSVGEAKNGDDSLYVGVVVDISQQKAAEEILRRGKEQAEENSRLKSEFVNMMSHELRTPLTVILGYLPLLKDESRLPEPALIKEIAKDIEASGEHLLHLINDLLDISKIEAGKMSLKRQFVQAGKIVQSVIETMKIKAQEKGIVLDAEHEDHAVFADPVRLRQILINLVGNAIKFTDSGRITVKSFDADGAICFEVIDSGCGIAGDELPYIFEKFHQADSSSTRAAGGSGLGLAITRRLVELHGGQISVDSTLGEGTIFRFSIPRKDPEQHGKDTTG